MFWSCPCPAFAPPSPPFELSVVWLFPPHIFLHLIPALFCLLVLNPSPLNYYLHWGSSLLGGWVGPKNLHHDFQTPPVATVLLMKTNSS